MIVNIPVSIGELIDKITILKIKSKYISDENKLQNIRKELNFLTTILKDIKFNFEIDNLYKQLYEVNLLLWNLEDQIRYCDNLEQFDETFIEVAKSIYKTNDQRSLIKKNINLKLNSEIVEEKSHT